MNRICDHEGNPLNMFVDGEVEVEFLDGSTSVETFENAGKEMELEIGEEGLGMGRVESVTFRLTDAKVAKSREVVEKHG